MLEVKKFKFEGSKKPVRVINLRSLHHELDPSKSYTDWWNYMVSTHKDFRKHNNVGYTERPYGMYFYDKTGRSEAVQASKHYIISIDFTLTLLRQELNRIYTSQAYRDRCSELITQLELYQTCDELSPTKDPSILTFCKEGYKVEYIDPKGFYEKMHPRLPFIDWILERIASLKGAEDIDYIKIPCWSHHTHSLQKILAESILITPAFKEKMLAEKKKESLPKKDSSKIYAPIRIVLDAKRIGEQLRKYSMEHSLDITKVVIDGNTIEEAYHEDAWAGACGIYLSRIEK